ncbi:MAG: hypothetical protein WCB71_00540, partial [Aestuariivirga sp.]
PAIASIESINEVCEFSVHRIWNKNSTYSYIYCSNSQATQKLVKDGYHNTRRTEVEMGIKFTNSSQNEVSTTIHPLESEVGIRSVGQKIEIIYSPWAPQHAEFANHSSKKSKEFKEGLEGVFLTLGLATFFFIGSRCAAGFNKKIKNHKTDKR